MWAVYIVWKFISFLFSSFCSVIVIFTTLSSSSLSHLVYWWFLLMYFSFQLLYSLILWLFFVFSNSLFKSTNFLLFASILMPNYLNIFMSWCFQTVVLEKTLKSRLDCKEIKPVNPKGNQPWIFIGRTVDEAEAPILWPHDVQSCAGKRPWCWERLKANREEGGRAWDG